MNFFKQSRVCFLVVSFFCFCTVFCSFSLEAFNQNPSSQKASEPAPKKVVYTCITGGYDALATQAYKPKGWDYVCFTDSEELLKKGHPQWKIRPLVHTEHNNHHNSRWHKLFPHLILPEYDISFYMDGNIKIKDSRIFDCIDKNLTNDKSVKLAINRHPRRNCIYEEAEECKRRSLDNAAVIDHQMSIFRAHNYPESNGLFECCMIYRRHDNEEVKRVMEDWWFWLCTGSKRDQLSFNFVIWLRQFEVYVFEQQYAHNIEYIRWYRHLRKREPG